MSSSTLIEVFGNIVFSFTRSVTGQYNPEEPEFTAESFGYNPLDSTGREWYCQPVDELIYQEYSDREATSLSCLASGLYNVQVINASSPVENEERQEGQQDENGAMAWKQLRPSALYTVYKSMYTGASISLLAAPFIGMVYILITFLCYKTFYSCGPQPKELIPVRVQWVHTISIAILEVVFYSWLFSTILLLFRPFQLKGVKRKLALVSCITYCLHTLYRVAMQALGKSYYNDAVYFQFPLFSFVISHFCLQFYFLAKHFCQSPNRTKLLILVGKMATPTFLTSFALFMLADHLYTAYNKQNKDGKLLIALFSPLIGVLLKVISRICVQRLYNITHPGYSFVLLAVLYFSPAAVFRVLQADLDSLQSIAIVGIIHGAAEVIERSTMVVIDHICHMIWKRKSAPWGSFRTPRRERLMADIAILSMLAESAAIVSVNGLLYLYQFIYLNNQSLFNLFRSFVITVSLQLAIEWFFTSVSLAIETRYQNMAAMAVWRRRWKRHVLLELIIAMPVAVWSSTKFFTIVQRRFSETSYLPCKMPFT